MKNTKTFPKIRALAREIEQIKEQQRRQGLFCHDRELLSCLRCGLEEDVTGEGLLIVAKIPSTGVDIGLRFSAVDEEKGLYRCPGCGKEVTVPEPQHGDLVKAPARSGGKRGNTLKRG